MWECVRRNKCWPKSLLLYIKCWARPFMRGQTSFVHGSFFWKDGILLNNAGTKSVIRINFKE